MADGGPERRLAAIVAIDVVGYSRLMGSDEEGTLKTLKSHQDAVTPLVQEHGGRLVGTAGDGLLLEFPSVVEALNSSIKIQALMDVRNQGIADETKMLFRVGINLGDIIIHTDNDVFGDGVNVAARIEQLAPPGGICISRTVRNHVRDRMSVNLEDMGEIEVKNIARPIRVFRVLKEGEVASKPPRKTPAWQKFSAIAAVVVALIAGGAGWWWSQQTDIEPADLNKYAFKLPEKPSIAVLPFDNLTGDGEQDYLGDGLTENIITVLADSPGLFVIARNSSFTYKGKATKVQQVAEELGVRYVLEGSVQKSGDNLRVTGQLIDALSGHHLWAGKYDRKLENLFELQDEIAHKISVELNVKLAYGEHALNRSTDPESFRLFSVGRLEFNRYTPDSHNKVKGLWTQLYESDPKNPEYNSLMGWLAVHRIFVGISTDAAADLLEGRKFAEKALAIDINHGNGYRLLAMVEHLSKNYDAANRHIERAVELGPSNGEAISLASFIKLYSGRPKEAEELAAISRRLEPYSPTWVSEIFGVAKMQNQKLDEAKSVFQSILTSEDKVFVERAYIWLAVINSLKGDDDKAKRNISDLQSEFADTSISELKNTELYKYKDAAWSSKVVAILNKLGLPENPPVKTPDKPSIAVLPFKFLGDASKFKWVADGLAYDISQKLTGGTALRVVGRANTGSYEGKSVSSKSTGEELGVDFVLTGAVRIEGTRLRINIDLSRVSDGEQKWAKTYDGELSTQSVFDFQDQITQSVTAAISSGFGVIAKATQERILNRPDMALSSYECIITSYEFLETIKEKTHLDARQCLEKLTKEEKTSSEIFSQLAYMYITEHNLGYNRKPDPLKRAQEAAETAVRLDAGNQAAWLQLAQVKFYQHGWSEFVEASDRALLINPEEPMTVGTIGYLYGVAGHHDKAVRLMDRALQLIPHPPVWWRLVYSFLAQDKGDWKFVLEQSKLYDPPWLYWGYARRAAAYGYLGNVTAAQAEFEKLLELKPDFADNFRTEMQIWNVPETRTEAFVIGFKKAGIKIPDTKN